MKTLLQKTNFPPAPGGDRYEWKAAETKFQVSQNGKYLIQITASANNGAQYHSTDDDDLRIALDDYNFGKYEIHDEKVSWKGFGTASSWDGASLKGNWKTIYFFKDENFEIVDQKPKRKNQTMDINRKGIPWMSFVLLGVKPKKISINATTQSATAKKSTDGDNVKIIVNGKIRTNPKAPQSKKYKNFYFSGDLDKGKTETLTLNPEDFEFLEDSVELWYDQNPGTTIHIKLFDTIQEWLSKGIPEKLKLKFYEYTLNGLAILLSQLKYSYSSKFLRHSLTQQPEKLTFTNKSGLSKDVKNNQTYSRILSIIRKEIMNGVPDGQILLGDGAKDLKIDFTEKDLKFSLHGLKKIEFSSQKISGNRCKVWLKLFDVYDFEPSRYDFNLIHNIVRMADQLEKNEVLKNFEIEIEIYDTFKIN